jgi:cytochrome c-type biogenesis protein CcmH
VAFLLVAGIGAATSYVGDRPEAAGSADTNSTSPAPSGSDDETLARLEEYTHSLGSEARTSNGAAAEPLPDVDTLIQRLVARLEAAPNDIAGWRMLGWSYFNMERYEESASAYARGIELDPSSGELKRLYQAAKAKASDTKPDTTASLQAGRANEGDGDSAGALAGEREAAIRSMVDGLAHRLENAPRDVDGWTRLMRSRVVLGERDIATRAFRKALDVFKDDSAASNKIKATAIDLGLSAE